MHIESELEEEIRLELEKLDRIMNDEASSELPSGMKIKNSYSAYEYAEAEGEKEELEDRLKLLLSKTDEFSTQISHMAKANSDLQMQNNKLVSENNKLQRQLESTAAESSKYAAIESFHEDSRYRAIELLLAETRSKLARAEAAVDDISLAKDFALQELEHERLVRIHIGI